MIRVILLYFLTATAALSQGTNFEAWQILDYVSGDFGLGNGTERAMLVVGADGYVDLVIISGYPGDDPADADILSVSDITGMVKYPPELSLTMGGGFEISQSQSTMGWGAWTRTDMIKYLDGDYYYVGHTFEFTRGIPPFDSITCEYDYEYGIVDVTVINENEEITLMEEYAISPEVSDFVDPEFAGVTYEYPDVVADLCQP